MKGDTSYDEVFMRRCLALASMGAGYTAPNPMVGAVLVHEGRIIGEGYHKKYGEAHAEVNAIEQAIRNGEAARISASVLYVSLEPCAHFGKTPPCADLIINHRIPEVVVGCRDPFEAVNGKGIEKMKAANISVITGVLEKECQEMNKRFFTFHTKHRPYIILKWAQTANEQVAASGKRLLITNENTNRLVHKWRSEEAGIMVGTNTAAMDNPDLTTRLWPGHSPVRLIADMNLRLPGSLRIFNKEVPTIIFNKVKHEQATNLLYYQVTENLSFVHQVVNALQQLKIQSVIVEGGPVLLQSFIDEGYWDEARVITNQQLIVEMGLPAPRLDRAVQMDSFDLTGDLVTIFKPSIN